ncbi:MAG: restriction endonuclease [Chloroflexi bacterium]|nr:restriction endonuclease [Chloroflexota bacterium]
MKGHKRTVDTRRIFFQIMFGFDCRQSYRFDDLLRASITRLYFREGYDPDVEEILQQVKPKIQNRINGEIDYHNRYKSYLRFYWSPEDDEVLIGNACPQPVDDEGERQKKHVLGNAFLLESILNDLAPDLFEILCKRILKELGCESACRTRATGDGGIDFFGTLFMHEVKDSSFAQRFELVHNAKVHFIGQAKRYRLDNVIEPQHIREFLGSALLLEFTQGWNLQKELAIENLPPKYLMPKDPVIWLFFSTSFATVNARELANYLGIYFQDGEDISRWLALNPLSACKQDRDELYFGLTKWLTV